MRRAAWTALFALAACAGSEGPAPREEAPLLFTRQRGAWTPEELNQDVIDCVDSAEAAILGDPKLASRPMGTARALLRERTVACMNERGWRLGAGPAGEKEWAE
jgi:hypothetical protein